MCGIAGWANFNRDLFVDFPILHDMTNKLTHRGPDQIGFWKSKNVMLGHTRLTIMDNNGGSQPMTHVVGNKCYTLVFNGEIYNYQNLKKQLESNGFVFSTKCDTEVVLIGFMHWGIKVVEKLNGIFAFGIWEEETDSQGRTANEKLYLARDQLGVKPLFYSINSEGLIFASEIMSLLKNPNVSHKVEKEGFAEIAVMSPSRTPGFGIFKDVSEVKPGEYLTFDKDGIKKSIYWEIQDKEHEDNLQTTIAKIKQYFVNSVERQLQADVPISCFLSGGLDSSAVCSLAANAFKRDGKGKLDTYSIDYVDNSKYFEKSSFQPTSDSEFAKQMVDYLGTNHTIITIDNVELANSLRLSTRFKGFPGMADVDTSLFLACKQVSQNHKVVLSGECADEIFGGYPWYWREDLLNHDGFPWMKNVNEKLQCFNSEFSNWINASDHLNRRYEETISQVKHINKFTLEENKKRVVNHLNLNWFMQTLLERKDRMSMACGVEARVPFGDHEIAQYVWNIPWEMKLLNGREKGLLREAFSEFLPDQITQRKKSPYPKTHNPIFEDLVKKQLNEIICDSKSRILEFVDIKVLKQMMSEQSDYGKPWFGQLMARPQLFAWLIQFEEWLSYFKVEV